MMKINVEKEMLLKATRRAASALNAKINPKINLTVKQDKNGILKLHVAADGNFYFNFIMDCEAVGAEGETQVNVPKEFIQTVNALSTLGDEFTLSFEDERVLLSCGQGQVPVPYVKDNGQAPELPDMVSLGAIHMKISDLRSGINVVQHGIDARAKGADYGWNNCVGIIPITSENITELQFLGCGTVGVAESRMPIVKKSIDGEMPALAVPVDPLSTVVNALEGENVAINVMGKGGPTLSAGTPQPIALFIMDGVGASYIVSLLAQAFPPATASFVSETSKGAKFKCSIKKSDILNAIKVANLQSTNSSGIRLGITLSLCDDKLRVGSYNAENIVDIDCKYEGDMGGIVTLSPYHFEKAISAYSGDEVLILTNTDTGTGKNCAHVTLVCGKEGTSLILPISNKAVEEAQKEAVKKSKAAEKAKAEEKEALEQ